MNIVIVDYGLCNMLSVSNALKALGASSLVSQDPRDLRSADRVILPGVGAFEDGMAGLRQHGFVEEISAYVQTGGPLLGICLGMQMLMDRSFEFGEFAGLGLIAGEVRPVDSVSTSGERLRVPHIGWNGLMSSGRLWNGEILDGLPEGAEMYFVHSFRVEPRDSNHVLAVTDYGGRRFCSVVAKGNVSGCQFHPEKSSRMGLSILRNFINNKRS
jgi:glutamine amidotransferase